MKWTSLFLMIIIVFSVSCQKTSTQHIRTICNPMDLSYRFMLDEPSRREAADPTIISHKGLYYLFASKSGGYWTSPDLAKWTFIQTDEIPTEEYAPTAISISDTVYFLASSTALSTVYKSAHPESGHWSVAKDSLAFPVWDPAFFQDDDGRLYLYWGCSNQNPLYGIEIDLENNFEMIGRPSVLIHANPDEYGWEVPGDYNTKYGTAPWIEGQWLNKVNGIYYLQYAGPGTEYKSYSDAVYTSTNPLGPYELAPHNPFASKPAGFAAGAGHGSTFADAYGNLWHIGTITISQKHMFERRLGLYPTFIDEDGTLYTATQFGDYPIVVPNKKVNNFYDIFPGWMLLSYKKDVTVSSSTDSLPPENMVDEDIRTYWAASSGDAGEWASIDLGDTCDVYAVQINFAEHNTNLFGRVDGLCYQYKIECSVDNETWKTIVDRQDAQDDKSHAYFQLNEKETCRYVRITNKAVPDGHFALSGFRVFGKGFGELPAPIHDIVVTRDPENKRTVYLEWHPAETATGYVIRYGIDAAKLYHSYMVYGKTTLEINSLNASQDYFFRIDAFNENGVSFGTATEEVF